MTARIGDCMAMKNLIRADHDGGVVEITLNRAPVNALSAELLMEFADLLAELKMDKSVRAINITSNFKVFSAGLDLKEAQTFDRSDQNAIVKGLNVGFLALLSCPKPVVVAVNGASIAGGLFFVLASDYRIAAPKSVFGLAEVRVGADFPVGPLEIARATLDPNTQRRLMLTGQPISAEAAEAAGIVDEIVPLDSLRSVSLAKAAELAQLPLKTYASVKKQIWGATINKIEAAIRQGATEPEDGWFNDETAAAIRRMIG